MEAVPRLPMISFELKTSTENASFGPRLKQYIAAYYGEDPESYQNEIYNLEALRSSAVRATVDVAGCQTLKKYYCQLHFLKSRFPMEENQDATVYFSWKDNYSDMVCSVPDIRFELMCILYNIGALHTQLGASDTRVTPEGMKMSCTHFQCAAWAFQQIKEIYYPMVAYHSSLEVIHFMIGVAFAQAQECILEKSMMDNRKATIIAKVAAQVIDFYRRALNVIQSNSDDSSITDFIGSRTLKDWIKYLTFKVSYHKCIALLYQGQQAEELQKMGERVAFYQAACEQLDGAKALSTGLKNQQEIAEAIAFTADVVEGKRKAAKNENEFIYHEEVPDKSTLQDIKGASLVKGISFSVNDIEVSGPDIFARLVPMEAHEASSLYSERKAKFLRNLGEIIETNDQELMEFMSALQLDIFDQMHHATGLPQEIIDRAAALSAKPTAIDDLQDIMKQLIEISEEVEFMFKEIDKAIQEETDNEKDHQEQMGKRAPSIIALELTQEAAKYKHAHKRASESNSTLNRAIQGHINYLKIMKLPLSQIKDQIPSVESADSNIDETKLRDLEMLISKVEEMRSQRAMLWAQLRDAVHKDDITNVVVTKQPNQSLDEIFTQELQKHRQMANIIEQNCAAQENIVQALTLAYADVAETRRYIQDTIEKRDAFIKALIYTCDTYEELITKASKGIEFYNKLENNVSKLLQRIKSACKVQQEEREQLLAKSNVTKPPVSEPKSTAPKLKDYLDARKSKPVAESSLPEAGELSSQPPTIPYPSTISQTDNQIWPPGVRPAPLGSEMNTEINVYDSVSYRDTTQLPTQYSSGATNINTGYYMQYPQSTSPYDRVSQYPAPVYTQSSQYPSSSIHGNQYPAATVQTSQYPATNIQVSQYPATNIHSSQYPATNIQTSQYPTSDAQTSQYPASDAQTSQYPASSAHTSQYPGTNVQSSQYSATDVHTNQYSGVIPQTGEYLSAPGQSSQYSIVTPQGSQYPTANSPSNQYAGVNSQASQYSGLTSQTGQYPGASTQASQYPTQNTQSFTSTYQPNAESTTDQELASRLAALSMTYKVDSYSSQYVPSIFQNNQSQSGINTLSQQYSLQQPQYNYSDSQDYIHNKSGTAETFNANGTYNPNSYSTAVSPPLQVDQTSNAYQGANQLINQDTINLQHYPTHNENYMNYSQSYAINSGYDDTAKSASDKSMLNSQNFANYYNAGYNSNYPPNQYHTTQSFANYNGGTSTTPSTNYVSNSVEYGYQPQQQEPQIQQQQEPQNQVQQQVQQPQSQLQQTQVYGDPGNYYSAQVYDQTNAGNYQSYSYPNVSTQHNDYTNIQSSLSQDTSYLSQNVATSQLEGYNYQYPSVQQGSYYTDSTGQVVQGTFQANQMTPQNFQTDRTCPTSQQTVQVNQIPQQTIQPSQVPDYANQQTIQHSHSNQSISSVPYNVNQSVSQSQIPTSQTRITDATTKESYVDLLSGLDFSVNQQPLIPQQPSKEEKPKEEKSEITPTVILPPKLVPSEEDTPISVPVKKKPIITRKPFDNADVKNLFMQEIEKFEKSIDMLGNKTLSGPTNLDLKWKEIQDKQDLEGQKKIISVARCYPLKNRSADILPYDYSRVELMSLTDDYINASYVKDVSIYAPSFIVTQAPLPNTIGDFWTMVYEKQVEMIVCLLNDSEITNDMYWPQERDKDLVVTNFVLTLKNVIVKPFWTERYISISLPEKRESRIITHLQFTAWPGSIFPTNPEPFNSFVKETLNMHQQQRSTDHPVVVHCSSGIGRSGLLCLLSIAILEVTNNPVTIPDLIGLTTKLSLCRRNILRDREHLKFAHEAFLSYMKITAAPDEKKKKLNELVVDNSRKMCTSPSNLIEEKDDPLSSLDPFWASKRQS